MQESRENYLETIYMLGKEKTAVHAIDVARTLGFSKPSVSRAMGLLKEDGYIEITSGSEIVLTKNGKKLAEAIAKKHEILTRFLMMTADVPEEIAEQDACHMEHFIQDETLAGIQNFMKQVEEYND